MMVGSIEPFIRGLYNAAPKCKKCGEVRQYWDDELCIKCRTQESTKKMFGGSPQPLFTKQEVERVREILSADDKAIPIICIPPITREDIIWAIRHPNRKRSKLQWQELKSGELTPEEEKILIDIIEYHKESLKLLAE